MQRPAKSQYLTLVPDRQHDRQPCRYHIFLTILVGVGPWLSDVEAILYITVYWLIYTRVQQIVRQIVNLSGGPSTMRHSLENGAQNESACVLCVLCIVLYWIEELPNGSVCKDCLQGLDP